MDVNCNSKLKQFFKTIMFIEVDICKSCLLYTSRRVVKELGKLTP